MHELARPGRKIAMMQADKMEKELNKSAHALVQEFAAFYQKEILTHPGFTKSDIFEPWAMQKISNLQITMSMAYARIDHLEARIEAIEDATQE